MKNLLNLKGAQLLNKSEQKAIQGGYNYIPCSGNCSCPASWFCNGTHCVPCKYNPKHPQCVTPC